MQPETEHLVMLGTRIPEGLKRELEFQSWSERRDMQDIIADALRSYLEKHNQQTTKEINGPRTT